MRKMNIVSIQTALTNASVNAELLLICTLLNVALLVSCDSVINSKDLWSTVKVLAVTFSSSRHVVLL